MKLLDIMKKYDRCLVRESAKLTKIYNMILKESEADETIDEETCPDCGNDPCTCESDCKETDEDEEMMSAAEFFGEAEKGCDECDMIPEEDFIKGETEEVEENDLLRNRPHNAHIDDPKGVLPESEDAEPKDESKKQTDEAEEPEEMMSAEEFFAEDESETETNEAEDANASEDAEPKDESEKPEEKTDEAEEMMSAEEFFAEDDESKEKTDGEEETDESEKTDDSEETDEAENDEKKLEESLKSYRRKNHHLFNA